MSTRYSFFWVALAGVLWASPAIAQLGTPARPLGGQSLDTVRGLAEYLDDSTQNVVITAQDEAQGNLNQRRWASALNDFARREATFRQHVDNYDPMQTNLAAEFRVVDLRGRRVDSRIRSASQDTRDDWDDVRDALRRLRLAMAGRRVEVPQADTNDPGSAGGNPQPYPRPSPSPTPMPPLHVRDLTDAELQRFRELAHELDTTAAQVRQMAEQNVADYRDGGRFLASLTRFAESSRALHVRSDDGQLASSTLRPTVDDLLREARRTDASMRQVDAFPMVWQRWNRTIAILNEMAGLFR